MAPPEPYTRPPCSVRSVRVRDAPAATSNRRKAGVPVLGSMVSPWPTMVRLSPAAMTGSPLPPSVVLSTAGRGKAVPAARVIALDSAARLAGLVLARLMSAIRSATLAAVYAAGRERPSSCSRAGRWRRGPRDEAREDAGRVKRSQDGIHMIQVSFEGRSAIQGVRSAVGAQ